MRLTKAASLLYDSLLAMLYPQECALCGKLVAYRRDGIACEQCWTSARLFATDEVVCWKCGALSSGARVQDVMSVNCRRCQGLRFSAARACGIYEGALRETVLHLKREPNLCRRLIDRANAIHSTAPLNRATRIIPVPLHPVREKARGFNQAAVIAGELAAVSGLPLSEMSLIRISHSDRYRAGMDSQSRQGTVTRAFAVGNPLLVAGERILLVDDVYTTGATVSACADVLLEAGAEEVLVLTLARAQYT